MLQLEPKAYSAAHSLLNDLSRVHVTVPAVLDGSIDGDIWVDRPVEPRVALLANGDAYYLAGSPEQASGRALRP